METEQHIDTPERNPDLITKEPGSHPVGTGVGAVAGGVAGIGAVIATGAVLGSAVGPLGTAMGVAVGAVAGGLAGKGVAEQVNPTVEETYWRENFASRPYVTEGAAREDIAPAYRYGWESRERYPDKTFDDVELDLERDWEHERGASRLAWADAKPAARDAWERVEADGIRACDAEGCCEMSDTDISDTDIDEDEEAAEYAPSVR
jgi:hypothetical protein